MLNFLASVVQETIFEDEVKDINYMSKEKNNQKNKKERDLENLKNSMNNFFTQILLLQKILDFLLLTYTLRIKAHSNF